MSARKRNNPLKRAQRFFTRSRLWHWESSFDEAHCVVRKAAGLWCAVDHDIAEGILRYRNHWRVCARVLLLAPDGSRYVEHTLTELRDVSLSGITGAYDALRNEAMQGLNTRHIIDAGWLAETIPANEIGSEPAPGWELFEIGQADLLRRAAWVEREMNHA